MTQWPHHTCVHAATISYWERERALRPSRARWPQIASTPTTSRRHLLCSVQANIARCSVSMGGSRTATNGRADGRTEARESSTGGLIWLPHNGGKGPPTRCARLLPENPFDNHNLWFLPSFQELFVFVLPLKKKKDSASLIPPLSILPPSFFLSLFWTKLVLFSPSPLLKTRRREAIWRALTVYGMIFLSQIKPDIKHFNLFGVGVGIHSVRKVTVYTARAIIS